MAERGSTARPRHAGSRQAWAVQSAIAVSTHDLEGAISCPARARERSWTASMVSALRGLTRALADHRASAEGEAGLLAELLRETPAAAYHVARLRDQHVTMLDEALDLLARLEQPHADGAITIDAARIRAAHLLTTLRCHQAEMASLIVEVVEASGLDVRHAD